MKKIILILAPLLCFAAYGQFLGTNMPANVDDYNILDCGVYVFTYKLSFVPNDSKPENIYTDIQALQIGSNISKYYSQYLIDYAEYIKNLYSQNKIKGTVPGNPEKGTQSYEIYKNYPTSGIMTVIDLNSHFYKTSYIYEEPTPSFEWQLVNESEEILDYHCRKATTTFRGRNFTAWFTMEIPISNGPWKFGGLPGLIMKIEDSERHYVFECIGMQRKDNETIKMYKLAYTKVNRNDLQKLYQRMHNDYAVFLEAQGRILLDTGDAPGNKIPSQPYNPIERE